MTPQEVLISTGVAALPVDPAEIAQRSGIKMVSYSACVRVYEMDMEELYRTSRYGFGFYVGDTYVCAINENACGEKRRRWTMAHELAHYFLGSDRGTEQEADRFAGELLAPTAVVNLCGVSSAVELSQLCGLSRQAGEIRYKEMCHRREEFILTPQELALVERFSPFIGRYLAQRARHDGYHGYAMRYAKNRFYIE